MIDLDRLWHRYAEVFPGLRARRPDFRFDALLSGARMPGWAGFANRARQQGRADDPTRNLYARLLAVRPEIDKVLADLVIVPELAAAIAAGQPGACELACELIGLGAPVDVLVANFSMAHYLATYPDVAGAGMSPLQHYLLHGAAEGRRTLADLRRSHYPGRRRHVPGPADLPDRGA